MRLLGAVLHGGQSRRYGSDKAQALLAGKPLIQHVIERIGPQVSRVVICGGPAHPTLLTLPDQPEAGLGPLAGLLAALDYGAARRFSAVLSAPCDTPLLPQNLAARLSPGPSYARTNDQDHPVLGLWPIRLAPALRAYLTSGERKAMTWAASVQARSVLFDDRQAFANVNDLASLLSLS
jgi:molybdenum cofactor guanylyltransferase